MSWEAGKDFVHVGREVEGKRNRRRVIFYNEKESLIRKLEFTSVNSLVW